MADNKKPEPKKKFISDLDMWEISLDMVGDDSIDPTHRRHDTHDEKPTLKQSLESKAKTARLNKQADARKPATTNLSKPVSPVTQSPRERSMPVRQSTPKPGNASSQPVMQRKSNPAAGAKSNPTSNSQVNHNKQQPVAKPAPARKTPPPASQRSNVPVQQNRPQQSKPEQSRPQVTRPQQTKPEQPRSEHPRSEQPRSQQRRESVTPKAEQTQPASFTTRDVNRHIAPQNLEVLSRKKRKERFLKIATTFWVIIDFIWINLTRITKLGVKLMPFIWRYKTVVSVGAICFGAGFFTSSIMNDKDAKDRAMLVKATAAPVESTSTRVDRVKTGPAKPSRTEPAPSLKSEVKSKQKPVQASSLSSNVDETSGSRQFAGRDILIEEVDPQHTPAEQDAAQQIQVLSTGQDNALVTAPTMDSEPNSMPEAEFNSPVSSSLSNDSVADASQMNAAPVSEGMTTIRVEPEAAVSAFYDKKIQQMGNSNSTPVLKNPSLSSDEINALLTQNVEAYRNKQWQRVIEISDKIITADPEIIDGYINRSVAHTELGMIDEAIADSNKAILLNPRNPVPINNRGYAYEKAGALDNAIADYQAACNLGVKLSCQETERLRKSIAPGE